MKTFCTFKDGKIDRIQAGNAPAGEGDWKEVSADWNGSHGDKLEWFDENMRRIPDAELVKQGKRKDNRGRVYNTDDKSSRIIYGLDEGLKENETKEAPLENEAHQKFDRQKNRWVVDTKKKERAEKENAIAGVQAQIADAETRLIRPLRAKLAHRETQADIDKYDEFETLIENELRPELDRLKAELKSA